MNFKFLLLATGILLVIIYTGCTKITPTDIGTDLLPAVDNVNTFDTSIRIYADNYLFNDSSRLGFTAEHALGIIENDPEFGKTDAQIYLSVVPASSSGNPFTSVDSIVGMDSVVLGLTYTGLYGDSNAVQKFNVYEVADTAFKDTVGYLIRHDAFNTTGIQLGSEMVNFTSLNDPKTIIVKRDTTVIENQMRIKLDPALGLRFAAYDTTVYSTSGRDSAFVTAFNGLALKAEASSPLKTALAYFNLAGENTKLTFYYRIQKNGVVDTVSTDFTLYVSASGRSRTANLIQRTPAHNYAGLSQTTGVIDAEKVYIQSNPGSYAILRIPGLTGISNRIVHRAELAFVPVDSPPDNLIYSSPEYLFLDMIDSTNNRYLTVANDFMYNASSYQYNTSDFGGYLKDGKYFFNLTRYVQEIATKQTTNYPLRLYAPRIARGYYVYPREAGGGITDNVIVVAVNSKISKGRAVIGGGSHQTQKMVLRIIYSKI